MPLVKGFQLLPNVTKNSILDVTGVLFRPLCKKKIYYLILKTVFISFEVIKYLFTPERFYPLVLNTNGELKLRIDANLALFEST